MISFRNYFEIYLWTGVGFSNNNNEKKQNGYFYAGYGIAKANPLLVSIRGIFPAGRLWELKVSRDRESWDRERDVCPPPPIGSMHAGGAGLDARFGCIVS